MLLSNLDVLATAPGGVARLRELILTLAVQGKLVPQDPADEPASELLLKIRAEKDRLIAVGTIKRDKPLVEIAEDETPFELPQGWEWARLGAISSYIQRGKGPVYAENSEQKVISQKCVRWWGLDLTPARFITPESFAKYETVRFLQVGDLLWNSTGTGTIGRACLVPSEQGKAGLVADSHVTVVRAMQIDSSFLWRWIQSPYVQSEIEGSASGTTNQIELNTSTVVNHLIPLPPLAEQSRIVTRVEELMRLCDALEAKGQLEATQHAQLVSTLLGQLTASRTPDELHDNWQRVAQHFDLLLDRPATVDALEQTILQLAVRGLLVPQDPTDEPASILLQKIRLEKDRLIAEGKIKRDKPLPPIAEDEKPFELPNGWEWLRLNDLIRIGSGDGLTAAQMAPAGTIPVYGGNGVNGHHDRANVEEPTLVIGRVGYYCGSIHLTPSRAWVTDNAFITRYPKAFLDMKWLYWLLVGTNLKENDSATAQPVISGRKVYPIVVALPPLSEQSRIVARVESLRRLCADLRQRLAARQTTQAHLAEALVNEVA